MNIFIEYMDLKNEGISNIEKINTLEINKIAKILSKNINKVFSEYGLNSEDLFISLSRLNMYFADFIENNVSAKFYFKSNSIYFNRNRNLQKPDSSILHECIHYLQTEVSDSNKLLRMGLLINSPFKSVQNISLNEAAVQYLACNILNERPSHVRYFNLEFLSPSPDFYPIETALIKQMLFFTGSYPLFFSTLFSNNVFQDTFINIASKKTFKYISKQMDKLLLLQDNLSILYNQSANENISLFKKEKIMNDIEKQKISIQNLVLNIQDTIFQNCFNSLINNVSSLQDCNNLKSELYNFKNLLIKKENDDSYEKYIEFAMNSILEKETMILSYGNLSTLNIISSKNSLVPKFSFLGYMNGVFNKLKLLLETKFKYRIINDNYTN